MNKSDRSKKNIVLILSFLVLVSVVSIAKWALADQDDVNWNQTIDQISKNNKNEKKELNCVAELIFGETGVHPKDFEEGIINFSMVFPNILPDPVMKAHLLTGASSEEKNVLHIFNDLHSKIVTDFSLSSPSCAYCTWAFVLPKVANRKDRVGNVLVFSRDVALSDGLFKGTATSTIAYDQNTLNPTWTDDRTDTGAEVLDVFLDNKDIVPKESEQSLIQIASPKELWEIIEKKALQIPELAQALLELKESNSSRE